MVKVIILFLSVVSFANCSAQPQGMYCAHVTYYNYTTTKQSSYTLTAKLSEGKLIQLNFPSGGHIDEDDFGVVKFDVNNTAIAKVGEEKTYNIKLIKKGTDCFNGVLKAMQCKGITQKGHRCKNMTDNNSGYCHHHQ